MLLITIFFYLSLFMFIDIKNPQFSLEIKNEQGDQKDTDFISELK